VAICVLWTLLGMGVGALIGSPVGTLVILLIYAILVGPISELILTGVSHGSHIAGFMPNGSANGMTGATASSLIFNQIQDLVNARGGGLVSQGDVDAFNNIVRLAAGAPGAFSLGISALIFVAWTGLFFGTGLYRNQQRDIT
jgi:ABC-2 type transport system permease protein